VIFFRPLDDGMRLIHVQHAADIDRGTVRQSG
jgi:hypothetical protein